jgi:hypothetical protein
VFGIDLSDVLVYLAGAVSAAIVLLRVVAPRTKTDLDDKALKGLEAVRPYLPAKGDEAKAAPVDAVSREKVRDHRDSAKSDANAVDKTAGFKTK